MLADWYFCACIRCPLEEAAIFLPILDELDDVTGVTDDALDVTLAELTRTDAWMQIYVIPAVLRRLGPHALAAGLRGRFEAYFAGLGAMTPERSASAFRDLGQALLGGDPAAVRAALRDAVQSLADLPARQPSSLPYLDSKDFLPDIFILAVIAERLRHDASYASLFDETADGASVAFRSLIDAALARRLGRLAFRLAIRVAARVATIHSAGRLAELIWWDGDVGLEPDLLSSWAEVLFSGDAHAAAVETIVDEVLTLTRLRERGRGQRAGRGAGSGVFRGMPDSTAQQLRLVWWQATLWELAVSVDPAAAAPHVDRLWTVPTPIPGGHVMVESPASDQVRALWQEDLERLLALRDLPRTKITHVPGPRPAAGNGAWAVFSPWVQLFTGKRIPRSPLYPTIEQVPVHVRLIAGALVAGRLLLVLPADHAARRGCAMLLAHAYEALWTLRLPQGTPGEDWGWDSSKPPPIPEPTFALAVYAQRRVRRLGICSDPRIAPDAFVGVLRDVNDAEVDRMPRDAGTFFRTTLPNVLMRWVADAYTSATGESPVRRWLGALPELYRYRPPRDFPDRLLREIVMRFLSDDPPRPPTDMDWLAAGQRDGKPFRWNLTPRQLLITPPLQADQWDPAWPEPSGPAAESVVLVRSLERLAALADPGTLPLERQEQWRREWAALLGGVDHRSKLDRFTRLRLLELLRHRVLQDDAAGLELIAMTLVQYGVLYDIDRLFAFLFPVDARAWTSASGALVELRLAMLPALFQDREDSEAEEQARLRALDPSTVRPKRERQRLIRNTLARVAFFNRPGQAPAGTVDFGKILASEFERRLSREMRGTCAIEADVESRPDGLAVLVSPDQAPVDEWRIRNVIYDPNLSSARLLVDDASVEGCIDFFSMKRDRIDAVLKRKESMALIGRVVHLEDERFGEVLVHIHCGLRQFFRVSRPSPWPHDPKAWLRVPVVWAGNTPEIDPRGDIRPLPPTPRADRLEKVRVRERAGDLEVGGDTHATTWDRATWDADLRRPFTTAGNWDRDVFARRGGVGQWAPVDRGLAELLLSSTEPTLVLTFIEWPNASGRWRFSTGPGDVYVLGTEDFTPADVAALDAQIDRAADPRGLLVSVRPEIVGGEVRLRLEEPKTPRGEHDLERPFDTRNLAWRDLFDDGDNEIAEDTGRRWMVRPEKPVRGFPREVPVLFQASPRARHAEFTVGSWDPWRGLLEGELVPTEGLIVPSHMRDDFVRRWLGPARSERVWLVRAIGKLSSEGDVLCRTQEGLVVSVEAESLSMRPLSAAPLFTELRPAEVTSLVWSRPETAVIDPEQLPGQIKQRGRGEGLVVRMPWRGQGTFCAVWWFVDGNVLRGDLAIGNIAELPSVNRRLGARITVDRRADRWVSQLYPSNVRARALWSLEKSPRPAPSLAYLGTTLIEDETCVIAEQEPGRLAVIPEVRPAPRHLAKWEGDAFRGGVGPDLRPRIVSNNRPQRGQREYRISLRLADGQVGGRTSASAPTEKVSVEQVRVDLEPAGEGLVALVRRFRLVAQEAVATREVDDSAQWRERLAEYFRTPGNLDAVLEPGRREVRLFSLRVPTPAGRWSPVVPLGPDEGPLVASPTYANAVTVRLVEDADGRVLASFRQVPPLTIDDYRSKLGKPPLRMAQLLDGSPLIYAGLEATVGDGTEIHHRFEWGYGCTLRAPESRLRFDGGSFAEAGTLLFYGDGARRITFLPSPEPRAATTDEAVAGDESTPDPEADAVLSVDGVEMYVSDATTLFLQRRDNRIIHVLRLTDRPDGRLGIESVLGLAERSLDTTRPFRVDRAVLDRASEAKLRQRWPAATHEERAEATRRTILARLDTNAFMTSLGAQVVFRHVRMSFEQHGSRQGNELVFVRAGRIQQLPNDMGLEIRHWDGLDDADVGEDCARLLMLRRDFSVREEVLSRLFDGKGANALEDAALLVAMRPRGPRGAGCALWWDTRTDEARRPGRPPLRQVPSRTLTALRAAMAQGVTLATVLEADGAGMRVELRPGVFVTVPASQIENGPRPDLATGALVRIENAGDRLFRITPATQGEFWFVRSGLRPAVALPKNPLLDAVKLKAWEHHDPVAWRGRQGRPNQSFSIGGLPDVEAVPGRVDPATGEWRDPVAREFVRLMESPHPKIVLVGLDDAELPRIAPAWDSVPWGRIQVDESSRACHAVLGHEERRQPLPWTAMSFADAPISVIRDRIRDGAWRYHDTRTGTWRQDGSIDPKRLASHSGDTGPLFFEERADGLRLRYSVGALQRFGLPARELAWTLAHSREGIATFPVAGQLPGGGLWIEIAPGRVASLPAALLVTSSDDHEHSLAHCEWAAFAPGDTVTLRLASSDPMTVDRIELVDVRPGPRGALGRRAFLPAVSGDERRGVTQLGAGDLILNIPVVWDHDAPPAVVVVRADNRIEEARGRVPARDDVVLLGLDEDGVPMVLGLPGLRPVAARWQELGSWRDDPLAVDLASPDVSPATRNAQLAAVIAAAGRVFAVTVEAQPENGTLVFSRRVQRAGSHLPAGRVARCRIAGLLAAGQSALVRVGSGLVKIPMRALVSGLPHRLAAAAIARLRQDGPLLWVRGMPDGEARLGLYDEPGVNFHVELVGALGDDGRGLPRGLVCRARGSGALYWLPAEVAAWTDLVVAELGHVFPDGGPLEVRLDHERGISPEHPPVSVIAVSTARHEWAALAVGKQLTVRVVAERGDGAGTPRRYLARSLGSGVLLELESYDGPLIHGDDVRAEVVRRGQGLRAQPSVSVVVGRRRYSFDLPAWMVDGTIRGHAIRPAFADFVRWCGEAPELLPGDRVPALAADDLLRGLCHAWTERNRRRRPTLETLRSYTGLAREWIRRYGELPEMELGYGLIAVLLLETCLERGKPVLDADPNTRPDTTAFLAEWRRLASTLTRDLGQRALRSAHVEVIAEEWLGRRSNDSPSGLRRRLGEPAERLKATVNRELFRTIEQFCHAVELRESLASHASHQPLAAALRRAMGQVERTDALARGAPITRELVELYANSPWTPALWGPQPLVAHLQRLRKILDTIIARGLDITLLDSLTGPAIQVAAPPS